MRLLVAIILLAGCASPAPVTPAADVATPEPERLVGSVDLRLVELRAPRVDFSTGLNHNCLHFDGRVERAFINATWDEVWELELDSNMGSLGLQASPAHWSVDNVDDALSLSLQMPEIAVGDVDIRMTYTLIGSGLGAFDINDCDL